MNTPRQLRIQFATWLDAFVGGTSTPVNPDASKSEIADLQRATAQIHDLSRRATEIPPEPSLVPSWETFMTSSPTIPIVPSTPSVAKPIYSLDPRAASRWLRLDRAAGLLLAAVLLLAITGGIWQATGGLNSGNDSPPPTDPTNANLGLVQSTPEAAQSAADIPTAEDCTVEPLTVDDVLTYIQYPYAVLDGSEGDYAELLPSNDDVSATPEVSDSWMATSEQISQVSDVQHMWMSCVLAESFFQKWALESPVFVQEQVLSALPPLTGIEQAREILTRLEEIGPVELNAQDDIFLSFGLWSTESSYARLVVDPNPANTFASPTYVITGYVAYEDDGQLGIPIDIFANAGEGDGPSNPAFKVSDACSTFQFLWFDLGQTWLVERIPECG